MRCSDEWKQANISLSTLCIHVLQKSTVFMHQIASGTSMWSPNCDM